MIAQLRYFLRTLEFSERNLQQTFIRKAFRRKPERICFLNWFMSDYDKRRRKKEISGVAYIRALHAVSSLGYGSKEQRVWEPPDGIVEQMEARTFLKNIRGTFFLFKRINK